MFNEYNKIYYDKNPLKLSVMKNESTELHDALRMLWVQHVYWTRMAVIGIANNTEDKQYVINRLLRNATDMGNLYREYYGDEVGKTVEKLIHEHLTLAAQIVEASKMGDTQKELELTKAWFKNADDIADALSKINPYYDRETLKKMLYDHLILLSTEVQQIIAKKYPESIHQFDIIEQQALMMADYLSQGIIRQKRL